MKKKTIVVETHEVNEYEFSDIDTKGNFLIMWMCPLRRTPNSNSETVGDIVQTLHDRYTTKLNELVGMFALDLLCEEGGIDDTFHSAVRDNIPQMTVDAFNSYFAISHLSEKATDKSNGTILDPGMYITMYDFIDCATLSHMPTKEIRNKLQDCFAQALNYAIEPYL